MPIFIKRPVGAPPTEGFFGPPEKKVLVNKSCFQCCPINNENRERVDNSDKRVKKYLSAFKNTVIKKEIPGL